MRELRVLVSPRVHVHRLAQESAWVGHAVRSLGDGSRWRGVSDMCELSMLMRTWVLAATTAGTTSTWAALLLLLLSLRALLLLLLRLLGALLLLAEGRVGTLAPNRTELVRVRALTTMTALTLLPLQNCSLSDIRDGDRLDRSLALGRLKTGEVHLNHGVHRGREFRHEDHPFDMLRDGELVRLKALEVRIELVESGDGVRVTRNGEREGSAEVLIDNRHARLAVGVLE